MENDPFYPIALQLAKSKSYGNDEFTEDIAKNIVEQMHEYVNVELLSRMTKDQMESFNLLLDGDPSPQDIVGFVANLGIDINDVNVVALTKFRVAYLGA